MLFGNLPPDRFIMGGKWGLLAAAVTTDLLVVPVCLLFILRCYILVTRRIKGERPATGLVILHCMEPGPT